MLEIPNDEWVYQKKQLIQDNLIKLITKKLLKLNENLIYSFSHFNLEVEIFFTKIKKKKFNGYQWLSLKRISTSGMPTLMKKIAILYLRSVKQ